LGTRISAAFQFGPVNQQASCTMVNSSFPAESDRSVALTTNYTFSSVVKERVELYTNWIARSEKV